MMLPRAFLDRPIAHRALHDRASGRIENSASAIRAAVEAGYGIEIDLQLSLDGVAMVFHDYHLGRLTAEEGPVAQRTAAELSAIALRDTTDTIPTLASVLSLVAGRVPLLIEIKDQDGGHGPNVGRLEDATATALAGYGGPVAVMSLNPHSSAHMASIAPTVPRGLTTCQFDAEDYPTIRADRRRELARIEDVDKVGACFISHEKKDLASPRVAELKRSGLPILCWTVRSSEEEALARKVADNVTFEGYLP